MTAEATTTTATTQGDDNSNSNSMNISEPNATLYVSNIDWKIKKPILRRALHTLFSRHGKILEIITLRKEGLRGQAFVIFADVSTATAALQAEQKFTFFGKPLNIQYAYEKSDRIAKRDGTYVPNNNERRKKKKRERELLLSAASSASNSATAAIGGNGDNEDLNEIAKKRKLDHGTGVAIVNGETLTVNDPSSLIQTDENNNNDGTSNAAKMMLLDDTAVNANDSAPAPPSKILFAESLPKDCNEMMLACLFRSYPGYKEVRIPRAGLAFIEFDDEPHASVALKALNGFNLSAAETLNLKYGKA